MAEAGITQLISVPLCGKEGPVGLLNIGALPGKRFHEDELTYLVNVANFLATTVENVNLFERVKTPSGFEVLMLISLVFAFLASIVLGGLGGALGSAILGRRQRS